MRPASPCKSAGFNKLSVGFKSMSIQYTLPVRLRSAIPGLNPSACAWATRACARFGFAVQTERNHRPVVRPRHFQRIVDAARLELGKNLLGRGTRGRQRQIHPDSRPDLAVGDSLPRIVAAAAQRRRRMGGFRHVAKRSDADAALHIGEQPGCAAVGMRGGHAGAGCIGAGIGWSGLSDASFSVAAGAAGAALRRSWRCRAPTGNSPRWPAPGTRQCSSTASSITLNHAQTGLAGHKSLHSVRRLEQQRALRVDAAGDPGNDRLRRATPAPAGRCKASSAVQASRNAANPSRSNCASILKSSSKMAPATKLRDGDSAQASATAATRTPPRFDFAARRRRAAPR